MPLVLLLFLRSLRETDRVKRFRSAVGAGLLLGFSFLAGHHIPVIHTGLFLLLYSGFRAAADWGKTGFRGKVAPFAVLGLGRLYRSARHRVSVVAIGGMGTPCLSLGRRR